MGIFASIIFETEFLCGRMVIKFENFLCAGFIYVYVYHSQSFESFGYMQVELEFFEVSAVNGHLRQRYYWGVGDSKLCTQFFKNNDEHVLYKCASSAQEPYPLERNPFQTQSSIGSCTLRKKKKKKACVYYSYSC